MPDQDLHIIAEQACKGERKAQEQLYRALYPFAMTIAMRYAADEHDAADILSHAFVKLFRHICQFDPARGSLHAWTKTIIIHEALDHVRQRARFSTMELELADEPAGNMIAEQMDAAALLALIRQLPPATHAVFILYAVDGYSHREIAAALGIREGTSKWHLSEARKILQQKLSNS